MRERLTPDQALYRARLECGHVVWLRNRPMTPVVRFGCNAGLGCGYRLHWTECWTTDRPDVVEANPAYPKKNDSEGEACPA